MKMFVISTLSVFVYAILSLFIIDLLGDIKSDVAFNIGMLWGSFMTATMSMLAEFYLRS